MAPATWWPPRSSRPRARAMKLSTASASASASDGSGSVAGNGRFERSGRMVTHAVLGAWAVIIVLLLRHREIISSDTLSNYVHVWFVANSVWHGHGVPFHMPVLAAGHALAFPYAFIPW